MTSTMPAIKMLHCLFCFLRQSDLELAMVKDALELPHLPISTSEGLGLQVCATAPSFMQCWGWIQDFLLANKHITVIM